MSILNDDRVTEIDGGFRVVNAEFGPVKVMRDGLDWAVYFDHSTLEHRIPSRGMSGSRSSRVEESIEWALRADPFVEVAP